MSSAPSPPLPSAALLARLQELHPRVIDLSLDRIRRLLGALGHPERQLPPVIHLAGTNGKGSTLAFLRAALAHSPKSDKARQYLRVHAYSSPHLVRFHERIELAGAPIADMALSAALEAVETANDGHPITFFEITTAAAFVAFAETPADVLLLETGLGGRLDATNVIADPALTCITPVALDHQGFLGPDLATIAAEKAGILRPDVPLVLAGQAPEADKVIRKIAQDVGAPIYAQSALTTTRSEQAELIWRLDDSGAGNPVFCGKHWTIPLPDLPLPGPHQTLNAGTALACLETVADRFDLKAEKIATALAHAHWPARLQDITNSRFGRLLPNGSRLHLDGAHNPHAAEALACWLRERAKGPDRPVTDRPIHLVTGLLANRDPVDFLRPFRGLVSSVTAVPIGPGHDGHNPDAIAATGQQLSLSAHTAPTIQTALEMLTRQAAGKPMDILIAGSLYLAGAVLAASPPDDAGQRA